MDYDFPIRLGISSSQLTKSMIFQGVGWNHQPGFISHYFSIRYPIGYINIPWHINLDLATVVGWNHQTDDIPWFLSKYTSHSPSHRPTFPTVYQLNVRRTSKGYGHFTQSCPAGLARKVGAPGMVTWVFYKFVMSFLGQKTPMKVRINNG